MSTRIRYSKMSDGSLRSTKVFHLETQDVQVLLNPNNKTFWVVNSTTGDVLSTGSHSNMNVLKQLAKKSLAGLGVTFVNESRTRQQTEEV